MTTGRPALVTRALRPPVRSPRAIPRLAPGLLAAVALTGLLGLAPVALSSGFSRPAPSVARAGAQALRDALSLPPAATVQVLGVRANDRALARALTSPELAVRGLRLAPGQRGLSGAVTAWLTVQPPGAPPAAGWARLAVRVETPQVLAARAVPRGEPLTAADLRVALRPLTARPGLPSMDAALGRTPTRALRPGEPVRAALLRAAPIVARGERVTAVVRRGAFEVRADAETLAAAPRGGTLRVRLLATRKTVAARALDPHTVEVLP